MPKFQSELQFASYLPLCSTTKDLPASGSSSTWLQNNKDQIQINGDGCNILHSPCKTSQLQDHEKEMIRKTMLQHEATFKNQVIEMHRLYGRQKELMDKIKMRYVSANSMKEQTSMSNSIIVGGLSASSDQTYHNPNFTLVDPSCHWPSSTFNFQVASTFDAGKSMQADTNTSIIASSRKDTVLLPSSSKEFSKKLFDLELPADEYIDCDVERFREGIVSGFSKAPDYAKKDLSAVFAQKNFNLSICNMEKLQLEQSYSQKLKTVYQNQTKEIDCFQMGKHLENLSEDLYLEKVSRQHEHASSSHLSSATKPFDTPASLSKNAPLSLGNYCLNDNVYLSRNLTYDPRYASVCSLQNNVLHRLPAENVNSSSMLCSHLSNLTNSLEMVTSHGNEQLNSTVQGLNCLKEKLVPDGISDKVKEGLSQGLGLSPPKDFLMSSSKWHGTEDILNHESINRSSYNSRLTSDQLFKSYPNLSEVKVADNYEEIGIPDRRSAYALTVSKMDWSAQSEMLKNGVYHKFQFDLNSSLNEDGSAQVEVETKSAADLNLKPPVSPVSPENKESSPPRGNSEEMQPTDLALFAAEALLLMSTNFAQSLRWFAGVVSSAANIQEEENETVQGRLAESNDCDGTGIGKSKAPASSSLPKRKRTVKKSQKANQKGKKNKSLDSPESCLPAWGRRKQRQAGRRHPAPFVLLAPS